MTATRPLHVAVIGAGLAGLAAAWDLARQGLRVTVIDAGASPGGLASSVDVAGQRVERFYHFICRGDDDLTQLASELGVADAIDWHRSTTSFFYEGRVYPFSSATDLLRFSPIPPAQRLRFGLTIVRSRLRKDWDRLDGISARQWLIDHMGEHAYQVIWDPLLRVKFGPYHNQISAAWMWHRLNRVARSRAHLLAPEMFGCFRHGSDVLVKVLAERLAALDQVTLLASTAVRRAHLGDGHVRALDVHGPDGDRRLEVDAVVSTIALSGLVRLVPDLPRAYREQLESIRYIGVVCGMLLLKRPITSAFWLNINDRRTPFNGIIEYTNLNASLRDRLGGRSIVYVPQYIRTSDPFYTCADDELHRLYLEALKLINPAFREDWVESWSVSREANAQGICTVGFKDLVPDHRSPVPNLYLTDSVQYYPEDRTISAAIRLGRRVATLLAEDRNRLPRNPACA